MESTFKRMIGHGAIVIFIGLAFGFGLVMSLIGGFEVIPGFIVEFSLPGDAEAWARAHVGGILNGLFVIAIALSAHALQVRPELGRRLFWMMVGTGYANLLFYVGGILSPSRSLSFGDNRLGESNLAGVLGLAPALVFAFVAMIAMVMLARAAFARDGAHHR